MCLNIFFGCNKKKIRRYLPGIFIKTILYDNSLKNTYGQKSNSKVIHGRQRWISSLFQIRESYINVNMCSCEFIVRICIDMSVLYRVLIEVDICTEV